LFDSYEEPLTAAGETGRSYRLAKMLVSSWRAPWVPTRPPFPVRIGRWRRAALNLDGHTTVRVATAPGTRIEVRERAAIELPRPTPLPPDVQALRPPTEPNDAPLRLVVPESGQLDVDLPGDGTRTVSFGVESETQAGRNSLGRADDDAGALFMVPADRQGTIVSGGPAFYAEGGFIGIAPDVRVTSWTRLHPDDPVVARIAPKQTALRVTVRAMRADEDDIVARARVDVGTHAAGKLVSSQAIVADLVASRFDSFRIPDPTTPTEPPALRHATDPLVFYVRFPDDGHPRTVELRGTGRELVQIAAPEPGVTEDVPAAAFRNRIALEGRWRGALYDQRRWTVVRPQNDPDLLAQGRRVDLEAQARVIETPKASAVVTKPERVLRPQGASAATTFVTSAFVPKGGAMPVAAARRLDAEDRLRIDAEGPRARRVTANYRVGRDALGGTATLFLDGEAVASQPIVALSGKLETAAPAGPHRISVAGLGAAGQAFVDAPPADGGAVQQHREVYRIEKDKPVTFRIDGRRAEHLNLVLMLIASEPGTPYAIGYEVMGDARPIVERPVLHLTPLAGTFSGMTIAQPADAAPAAILAALPSRGFARAVIPIGDDLEAGTRTIRLSLRAPDELTVRAVLVGQEGSGRITDNAPRLWLESDE
jgi:hypothetical protein